jgi:hypothetical protein
MHVAILPFCLLAPLIFSVFQYSQATMQQANMKFSPSDGSSNMEYGYGIHSSVYRNGMHAGFRNGMHYSNSHRNNASGLLPGFVNNYVNENNGVNDSSTRIRELE